MRLAASVSLEHRIVNLALMVLLISPSSGDSCFHFIVHVQSTMFVVVLWNLRLKHSYFVRVGKSVSCWITACCLLGSVSAWHFIHCSGSSHHIVVVFVWLDPVVLSVIELSVVAQRCCQCCVGVRGTQAAPMSIQPRRSRGLNDPQPKRSQTKTKCHKYL